MKQITKLIKTEIGNNNENSKPMIMFGIPLQLVNDMKRCWNKFIIGNHIISR
jgi:hypothetical protein